MKNSSNDDSAERFRKALREHDVEARVKSRVDPIKGEILTVSKRVNGEKMVYEISFSERELQRTGKDTLIERRASKVASHFREEIVTRLHWGDKHIEIYNEEQKYAVCPFCGSEASLESIPDTSMMFSESTTPKATYGLRDSIPTAKEDLMLLSLVTRECDFDCPNNPRKF
jgi:hypothetical protein